MAKNLDPSRTTMIRRAFMKDIKKRFSLIKKNLQQLFIEDDVLGEKTSFLSLNEKQAWRFQTDSQKITSFRLWLKQQVDDNILISDNNNEPWTNQYIESAYKRGVQRGYEQVYKSDLAENPDFYQGTKQEFLRSSFSTQTKINKVELIYTRTYENLRGITEAMSSEMSRTLADGLVNGLGSRQIAKNLSDNIDTITRKKALVLARTEVVYAQAEGQLDSYDLLGVEEVGVQAEWSTAGDDKVCSKCSPLEGLIMTTKEARGMLPRHPNCRCAYIPAFKDEIEEGQIRGKQAKENSIDKSIQAEKPNTTVEEAKSTSSWIGKEKNLKGTKKTKENPFS